MVKLVPDKTPEHVEMPDSGPTGIAFVTNSWNAWTVKQAEDTREQVDIIQFGGSVQEC